MDDDTFGELLDSVHEMKEIQRGESVKPYWSWTSENNVYTYQTSKRVIGRIVEWFGLHTAVFYHLDGIENVHPFGALTPAKGWIERNYKNFSG